MYLLGFDVGSSSVKASLLEAATGKCIASAYQPKQEMPIMGLNQVGQNRILRTGEKSQTGTG